MLDEIVKAMRELEKMGISGGGRNRLEEERRKLKTSLEEKEVLQWLNQGKILVKLLLKQLGMEFTFIKSKSNNNI